MEKSYYEARAFRWRGRLTTIKLEPEWWRLLAELCEIQGRRTCDVLSEIEKRRGRKNRAAAVRLYVGDAFAEAVRLHATTRMDHVPGGGVRTCGVIARSGGLAGCQSVMAGRLTGP